MSIVEIDGLVHRYENDGDAAVSGVSLSIDEGEFVLVCGRNGSGKTTLLRHLNALLEPDEGEVKVDGKIAHENKTHARTTVGMVFQDARSQIVGETVEDDVAFGPENLGLEDDEIRRRVDRALSDLSIRHLSDRSPRSLSGGEVRRLAVAGVLAMEPRVVVLDEPLAGLDSEGVEDVLEALESLKRKGMTVLVATHSTGEFIESDVPDRMVVVDDGKVVEDGEPFETVLSGVEEYGVPEPYVVRLLRRAGVDAEAVEGAQPKEVVDLM